MKKLLVTTTSYPPAVGGAQVFTHQLARHLSASGAVRAEVVTSWTAYRTDWLLGTTLRAPRKPASYRLDGIAVHRLGLRPAEKLGILAPVGAFYLRKEWAIDRISDLFAAKLAALGADTRVVMNVRAGREYLGYAALKLARRLGVPFVLVPLHHPRWTGRWYRPSLELYRQADGLIVMTEWEKGVCVELGVEPSRICVSGMGHELAADCDGDRFRHRHDLGDAPLVLFLGQKYRYKGLASLIQAIPEVVDSFPAARFVFVGPRTPYSRRLFRRSTHPRILELGTVDLQTKTDALGACDVLCVPSAQESFGGVYTEAWALHKPVIGGPAPAVREVISDGVDGFFVAQDPAEIADRLCRLLANPSLRREFSRRGRAKVERRFTWESISARVEGLLDRLTS